MTDSSTAVLQNANNGMNLQPQPSEAESQYMDVDHIEFAPPEQVSSFNTPLATPFPVAIVTMLTGPTQVNNAESFLDDKAAYTGRMKSAWTLMGMMTWLWRRQHSTFLQSLQSCSGPFDLGCFLFCRLLFRNACFLVFFGNEMPRFGFWFECV